MGWLFFFHTWVWCLVLHSVLHRHTFGSSVLLFSLPPIRGVFFSFGLPAQSSDLRSCRRCPFLRVQFNRSHVRNFAFYFPAPRIFQSKTTRVTFIFSTRNCLQHHNLRNSSHLPITFCSLAKWRILKHLLSI